MKGFLASRGNYHDDMWRTSGFGEKTAHTLLALVVTFEESTKITKILIPRALG